MSEPEHIVSALEAKQISLYKLEVDIVYNGINQLLFILEKEMDPQEKYLLVGNMAAAMKKNVDQMYEKMEPIIKIYISAVNQETAESGE